MHSALIVAKMDPSSSEAVSELFADFDQTEMPDLMGTRRRELFSYRGLYFHLQDFDDETGGAAIEAAKTQPAFVQISTDLKGHVGAYDPTTWRSPADALATRFYHWASPGL